MRISDLIPDKRNANKGTKRGAAMLEESLKNYGAGRSILADKKGRVIAGNKTLEAAGNIGLDDVVVVKTDGSKLVVVQRTDMDLTKDKRAKELAIADNRASEVSLEWDGGALEGLGGEVDLTRFFSDNELAKLLPGGFGGGEEAPEAKIDKAEELQQKWGTSRGQIWQVGPHRLMCGDSTIQGDVAALMGNTRARMAFTDPPWNVAIGQDLNPRHRQRAGLANDALAPEAFRTFLAAFAGQMAGVVEGDVYCVLGAAEWPTLDRELRAVGYYWSATIIWAKDQFVLGRSKYHRRYEPLWYGWHAAGKSSFCGGRDLDDVWDIPRPKVSEDHPTMKPVELPRRAIANSSSRGDVVYEPFLGAGSTMAAAHQASRRCYGMEIEPKYVAVALERMADMGLTPKLTNGKTSEQQRKQETAHPARGRKEISVQARAKRQPRRQAQKDPAVGRLHRTACAASA